MSRKTIRFLIICSIVSILCVVITQIYWVRRTLEINERQFNQQVHTALWDVASELATANDVMLQNNPVEQLSPQYFLVNTNSKTQPVVLESLLTEAFRKHGLITDFEVGVYDCTSNKVRYAMSLSTRHSDKTPVKSANWLKTDKFPYYFGIRFPSQTGVGSVEFKGWVWSSVIILIALSFFGYALIVILKQKQLSEVQRDFVNNMTHELQTPISTIRIASEVLAKPEIHNQPDRYNRYVRIVGEEISKLQRQVEATLTIAKAEDNKLNLNWQEVNANEVITRLASKFENRVRTELDRALPQILADPAHFEVVLTNLIDNAMKYSGPESEVVLRTSFSGTTVSVDVSDNGIGISEPEQKKIFEKFYRVPTGNIHNVKGFGIGLSYVSQLVKAHHWKIEVASKPGEGSTFTLRIPVVSPN